jgi:hypothetical protein
MIGWFFDMLVLLSAAVWLLKLAVEGYITAEQTAIFLFGFVVLLAVSRALKIGMGRLIFRIGIPIASLWAFAVTYGQGQMGQSLSILGSVLTLLVVLFGLYIMISGPFRKSR